MLLGGLYHQYSHLVLLFFDVLSDTLLSFRVRLSPLAKLLSRPSALSKPSHTKAFHPLYDTFPSSSSAFHLCVVPDFDA